MTEIVPAVVLFLKEVSMVRAVVVVPISQGFYSSVPCLRPKEATDE